MKYVFDEFSTGAIMKVGDQELIGNFNSPQQVDFYTFIRATDTPIFINVDGIGFYLMPNQIIALTPIQYLQYTEGENAIIYQFNREFYCIKDHDKEVSCVGVLFFGLAELSIVDLDVSEQKKFNAHHELILEELSITDTVHAEMLRLLLKRFIIKTTRLLKEQRNISVDYSAKFDLLRAYNFLVEEHFKTEHQVSFYANLLNRSPKTLSNTFRAYHVSPSQLIQNRIVLEAKRLLIYTSKSLKEIGYDLGFEEASNFSRLFKKNEDISPSDYRKKLEK